MTLTISIVGQGHTGLARANRQDQGEVFSTEQRYSKVEGELLGILTGIRTNKRYLYSTKFEVIVDHQLLVSLYNRKKKLPVSGETHL